MSTFEKAESVNKYYVSTNIKQNSEKEFYLSTFIDWYNIDLSSTSFAHLL